MDTRSPRKGLRRTAQIAGSAGILAAFAWTTDWGQARDLLARANPWILVMMALLFPLDRLLMAWKWHLLARIHDSCVDLWTGTRIYLGSSAAGLFLPLGGLGPDLVRTVMLTSHGMRSEAAVSSILVERLCGTAGAALMLVTAILLLLVLLPGQAAQLRASVPAMLAVLAAALGAILAAGWVLAMTPPVRRLGQRLRQKPAVARYAGSVRVYAAQRRLLLLNVLLSWLEQLAPILAFYLAFRGFGIPLTLFECAAIVPLASILERLPVSVAGLGVRELGIVMMAGLFGVARTDAFLVSLFEHMVFMLTMLPLGLLYLATRRRAGRAAVTPPLPERAADGAASPR